MQKFEFVALPPIKLKGKEQLCPIFKPVTLSSGSISESSKPGMSDTLMHTKKNQEKVLIVGRSTAQSQLRKSIDSLYEGGSGEVQIIVGHAGIGKSVLLQEAMEVAMAKTLKTYFGAGDSLESSTPYYMWRNIFEEVLDLKKINNREKRRLHVMTLVGEEPAIEPMLPLLNAVIPLDIPENEKIAQMSKPMRGTATHVLLLTLLKSVVNRG